MRRIRTIKCGYSHLHRLFEKYTQKIQIKSLIKLKKIDNNFKNLIVKKMII